MVLVLAAGCCLASCEGAPMDKAAEAKGAVEEARQAEADKYAAEAFVQLEDSLRVGLIQLDREQAAFGLFRDYRGARHAFDWVRVEANKLRQQAQENKESLQKVTADMLQMASTDVEATASQVVRIPRRLEYIEEIHTFKNGLKSLRTTLQEMNVDLRKENFDQVQSKAKAVQEQAEKMRKEIRAVLMQGGAP